MIPHKKHWLGFDYGTVRLGLAVSHGTLAEPLKILANNEEKWRQIAAVIGEEGITGCVVGISEGEMEAQSRQFAAELGERVMLPVEFMDETLSSWEIGEIMKSRPLAKRREPIDHLAAALILQNFLDQKQAEEVWKEK